MDNWERIDKLEKDVKYLEDIIYNHLVRTEKVMEQLIDITNQFAAIINNKPQKTSAD